MLIISPAETAQPCESFDVGGLGVFEREFSQTREVVAVRGKVQKVLTEPLGRNKRTDPLHPIFQTLPPQLLPHAASFIYTCRFIDPEHYGFNVPELEVRPHSFHIDTIRPEYLRAVIAFGDIAETELVDGVVAFPDHYNPAHLSSEAEQLRMGNESVLAALGVSARLVPTLNGVWSIMRPTTIHRMGPPLKAGIRHLLEVNIALPE